MNVLRPAVCAVIGLLLWGSAGPGRADPPDEGERKHDPRFSRERGWVFWADQGLVWPSGIGLRAARVSVEGDRGYSANLQVALDRLLTERLSAGFVVATGVAHLQPAGSEAENRYSGALGFRLGLRLPLSKVSVFWPSLTGLAGRSGGRNTAGFEVSAPAVRQIWPRFLLGVGPSFEDRYDWAAGTHRRAFALKLSFGGIFAEPTRAVDSTPTERFGEQGQRVVSAEHGMDILTGSSAQLIQVREPEQDTGGLLLLAHIDYFLFRHVSVGFTAGFGSSGQVRDNATFVGSVLFAGLQAGAAIPLSEATLLWPKVSLLWGLGERSRSTGYQAFVPFAVQFGHLLVGAGPSFEMALYSYDDDRLDFSRSAIGISFLVAGWWRS